MGYLNSDGLETQIQYIKSYVEDEIKKHASIPIGHEYFSMNPNIPQGSLPLLGGVYSRETYADLWDWVQTQTGYLITESAWQALSNTQNGNVPFYSNGDGSTTFRVPALKCWIKGTDGTETVGTYLDAGLPNITGMADFYRDRGGINPDTTNGVFYGGDPSANIPLVGEQFGSYRSDGYLYFDASRSSSIYGNANTVQPESIVGMWLVKAYGVIVDTGSIDEQQYIDDRFAAAKDYTDMEVETGVPTGCVQAFAGQNTPTGWLLCDGSAVSRVTYAKLFSVIGITYGAGDGSTTFNLPNLIDKFVQGNATSGTVKSAGLPNITGWCQDNFTGTANNYSGALKSNPFTVTWSATWNAQGAAGFNVIDFDASRSSAIYGNSTTVQPPALTMKYIIKY